VLFSPGFNPNCNVSTHLGKHPKYEISRNSIRWQSPWYWKGRHLDRYWAANGHVWHVDAPKNCSCVHPRGISVFFLRPPSVFIMASVCVCVCVCVRACVCVCAHILESSDSKICRKFISNRCWTNTVKGNKATEPKPSFYAFCDKVSKEMYQFSSSLSVNAMSKESLVNYTVE